MPKSYRRNADEIRNAFQNRPCMPKSRCQKPNAKECKHDLSSNQHTEKVMKYKKKTKEKVNMLQRPSSLKQMNFKMECFSSLLVTINTVQRWLQHSVVSNNETQSRNSRAVALSTHARLRFNSSSLSSLLGAFDLVSLCFLIFLVFLLLFF